MNLEVTSKMESLKILDKTDLRLLLSSYYLEGEGIEIGALHLPLALPSKAKVKYVDRLPVNELRQHYPELNDLDLVNVDIIDDGEKLLTIPNSSLSFIVANHMLEHCMNPIQTIANFATKLKKGGIIYIGIPDKRFSFDKDRELTTFDHLLNDFYNKNDHFQHYLEWAQFVNGISENIQKQSQAQHLFQMQYSIHFHVWDYYSFVEFIIKMNHFLGNKFDVLNVSFNDHREEVITILRKNND